MKVQLKRRIAVKKSKKQDIKKPSRFKSQDGFLFPLKRKTHLINALLR
jgi:hypothetical protein